MGTVRRMTMKKCSICGDEFSGMGHNPQPILPDKKLRCCEECNAWVFLSRLARQKAGFHPYGDLCKFDIAMTDEKRALLTAAGWDIVDLSKEEDKYNGKIPKNRG
jgi:hypothetical protein